MAFGRAAVLLAGWAFGLAVAAPATALAQAHDATLTVTVVDPTGGVLPTAVVTLTGQEAATQQAVIKPVTASNKGVAVFEGLAPGRYQIAAELSQFNPTIVKDVQLKSGDNKRTVTLTLKQVTESVTVTEDRQTAASDRTAVSFGTTVNNDQVQSLSDDPTELQRQIQAMAGPDAVIRVDGFEGAPLPPKSQIKAIHIVRDQFAAENHYAGGTFIDIVTQPGVGPPHGMLNANENNWNLDGRNPLLSSKTPTNTAFMNYSYGQSLAKNRADFTLNVNQRRSYTTPSLYLAAPDGTVAQVLDVRAPNDFLGGNLNFNYALTPDQTLKVWVQSSRNTSDDNGVGGMNQLDRAFSTTSTQQTFRVQEAGPIGRRLFLNTRVLVASNGTSNASAVQAPTIAVEGAFTSGGAQVSGGTEQRNALVQSDLDYIRGINSVRMGVQLQGTWYHTNANTNYLGTYSYADLDAYLANSPSFFTQNIGDPVLGYNYFEGGVYVQDDVRVRKSFTISPGVRYELQNHFNDHSNVEPRIGLTWAPFKGGGTTLRASAGVFRDWISNGIYEQSLRLDGIRQQQLNIIDPVFGDVATGEGSIPVTGLDLLGPDLKLARTVRFSAAISQNIGKPVNVSVVYAHNQGTDQLSGVNLNAPVDGLVPNPAYSTVMQAQSNARSRSYEIETNVTVNLTPASAAASKARFDWRRMRVSAYYRFARSSTDALGAFTPSPSGTLDTEWGPSANDIRHVGDIGFYSSALKNFTLSLFATMESGAPYNETTGDQDPGDLLFDLRPVGVSRNSLRMPAQWDVSASMAYTFGFHKRSTAGVPGQIGITMNGGQIAAQTFAADPNRFHVSIGLYVVNLTNHANYNGFSGIETSRFFAQPTGVSQMRSITFSTNFRF